MGVLILISILILAGGLAAFWPSLVTRSFKVTPTAPMGGGTQLFEGVHLTGGIRAFVVNQANVAITCDLLL